jgi:hypothetical protein
MGSENICSNSGGAKEKGKTDRVKLSSPQKLRSPPPPPLNTNVFYFFESHPIYDQTEGSSVVFLNL